MWSPQTGGPGWVFNLASFWGAGQQPGEVSIGELLVDTLAILDADASAAEQAGLGCNIRNAESTFRLTAYIRPWYDVCFHCERPNGL